MPQHLNEEYEELLTDEELERLVNSTNWNDSEDEFESLSEDDDYPVNSGTEINNEEINNDEFPLIAKANQDKRADKNTRRLARERERERVRERAR